MFSHLTPESLDQFRALYFQLSQDTSHSVLLDSCGWEGVTGGLYVMAFEPEAIIQLRNRQLFFNGERIDTIQTKAQLWKYLSQWFSLLQAGDSATSTSLPFQHGWVGAMGYEVNSLFEPGVPARDVENPMGQLYLVQFKHRIIWQPASGTCEVLSPDPDWEKKAAMARQSAQPIQSDLEGNCTIPPTASFTASAFARAVDDLKEHIYAGNIYQANLSIRFEQPDFPRSNLPSLYMALVHRNPSPFSGLFQTPEGVILSNSPERLVKYDSLSHRLETRPIAGTRGRGKTREEERQIAQTLQADPKEQAEHLMLVDLERNDLGRVAAPASVHVPESFVLERYSHVTHLVSQVEALKAQDKSLWQVIEALFPGGTITGCPKVRCMQILAETEPVPRGFYTGSLGYIDASGNLDFNILIRSLFHWPDNRLHYHAGAGIVADSVPAWEYRECLRKAEVIQGVLRHDHHTSNHR